MHKSKRRRHIKTNLVYTSENGATMTMRPVSQSRTTLAKERKMMLDRRRDNLRSMPASSRAIASMVAVEHGAEPDEGIAPGYAVPWEDEMEWEDVHADTADLSHEGGEYKDMYEHLLDLRRPSRRYQRTDTRTRRDRLRALQRNWDEQMPELVTAYLQWKHLSSEDSCEDAQEPGTHSFDVLALWTHKRADMFSVPQRLDELANVSLIRQGLLGCTPVVPSVSISLDTLELYLRLRRRHAQLSIQPMVRALCDIHNVNYSSVLREQFSIAFDIYLDILRRVQSMVDDTLGHDSPEWRAKNACPCCNLKLRGEVELHPARLLVMDGNNSAKRIAKAGAEDERVFKSDYFLSREDVDRFKDEVKRKHVPPETAEQNEPDEDDDQEDAPWLSEDAPGDAPDGQTRPTPCTQRWKASAAEHEKRALDIYETTGIFVSACRHGLIQKACEMIRSGELAKYPLAITNWMIDVHKDECGCGYDIGCAFNETARNSALVGPKVREHAMRFVVCAFHGYAHNRLCQLHNHPLYICGFGIEDLEGMERVFSSSNSVARAIRHASLFHYLQWLDLHFMQWDEDRYAELSRFLYNNYRQCLSIIKDYSVDVAHLKDSLGLDDAAIEAWLQDERAFLKDLKDEPEDRVLECAYVQALIDRERAEQRLGNARDAFVTAPAGRAFDTQQDIRMTRRLERTRRAAQEAAYAAIEAVNDLESKLDIEHRWTPQDAKYQETLQFMRNRDFHRALEKVQQLVIQRLLEMSKANMTGMGYKMRTSIWKALKMRGKAIRSALNKYNGLAAQMTPPAPTLEWKDVVNYTFVSEFDLLRHSQTEGNVTTKPWTVPYNREVATKFWKMRGARDEITRLNVEHARLHTNIKLQEAEFKAAMKQMSASDPALAAELRAQCARRTRINAVHLRRLALISRLDGFSGSLVIGTPSDPHSAELLRSLSEDVTTVAPSHDGDDMGQEDSDDDEMARLTDVLEGLAVAG